MKRYLLAALSSASIWSLAFAAGLFAPEPAEAQWIEYHFVIKAGMHEPESPLAGADLSLVASWTPELESPRFGNGVIGWTAAHSKAQLFVSGTSDSNGIYEGHFPDSIYFEPETPSEWTYLDDVNHNYGYDAIFLPTMVFEINGRSVAIPTIVAHFDDGHFDGDRFPTERGFSPGVADWRLFAMRDTATNSGTICTVVSGYATVVPEPASAVTLITGLFGAILFRRRK
ncbi:PEP-CTERM sorting domain-containing protein [Lacipirellula sp.]|uniref:PEP-CTERM sorting domain-containing protein n=1 Tax=Lacipirellula sp. TaxID=2691419 RepID=UPI003D144801